MKIPLSCSCLLFLVCDWTMLLFSRYQLHGWSIMIYF